MYCIHTQIPSMMSSAVEHRGAVGKQAVDRVWEGNVQVALLLGGCISCAKVVHVFWIGHQGEELLWAFLGDEQLLGCGWSLLVFMVFHCVVSLFFRKSETSHEDMIWYDMIWHDMIWYDMTWYDMTRYDMIWYDMIRSDLIWYIFQLIQTCFFYRFPLGKQRWRADLRLWSEYHPFVSYLWTSDEVMPDPCNGRWIHIWCDVLGPLHWHIISTTITCMFWQKYSFLISLIVELYAPSNSVCFKFWHSLFCECCAIKLFFEFLCSAIVGAHPHF